MIKIGKTGWASKVDALGVKYDGGGGCWLHSSQRKDIRHTLLQAQNRHAKGWYETFSPHEGKKGLLFSGGHKPEKYDMKASASVGGVYFVEDENPERYHNQERR